MSPVRRLAPLALLLLLAGCRGCPSGRPPIHLNPNMDNQPKYLAQAESAFFADGATMRPPVAGTVARGELGATAPEATGLAGDAPLAAIPYPVDETMLLRGAERYEIYCGPCHGDRGDGRGMLYLRSQVTSADLTTARIAAMPAGQLYQTIREGFGLMPGYASVLPVADRWAIVAHVERLAADAPVPAAGAAGAAASAEGEAATAGEGGTGPEAGLQDTMPEIDPIAEAPGGETPSPGLPGEGEG